MSRAQLARAGVQAHRVALLSHRSAGAAWALIGAVPAGSPVDVGIRSGWRAPDPGVRVHRLGPLPPDEMTCLQGISTTTPARTLLDLAGCMSVRDLEGAPP